MMSLLDFIDEFWNFFPFILLVRFFHRLGVGFVGGVLKAYFEVLLGGGSSGRFPAAGIFQRGVWAV